MNKLQAMEVFVQVVDTGSFTRASDQMNLPKATVSTLVQGLENALSVKLLHRTTRHVSVTSDGAVYYERCLRILAEVRDAEESLSRERASPSGRLRIDVATGVANDILIPALPDFFARYPDIALEMGCGDRTVDLIEEGVDCAIRGGVLPDSNLIARRIGVLHFVTGATPGYVARYGTPGHPNDLRDHVCINYFSSRTGKIHDWDFVRGGEEMSIPVPGHFAELVFASWPGVETDSAGLGGDPEVPLSREQLEWATIVFVMEKAHRRRLASRFRTHLNGKRVICLDIPDDYAYMQPALVALLEKKAGAFLR